MARAAKHREAIVRAAARLFRKQGFAATGLNQIVEESGAPKGSLYHYFPGGKEAIGAAAVVWAGERVQNTLTELTLEVSGPGDLLRRYAELLGGWMSQSGFSDGCPIATTLLETVPDSAEIRQAGHTALSNWSTVLHKALLADGVPEPRAKRLAFVAIATLEGALIHARVEMRQEPILDAAEELALAFEGAIREASCDC